MSFLEMLDVVNEELIGKGEEPIAFDHDCREGICGMCGLMINGSAHGPRAGHDHLPAAHAAFRDGDASTIEPWRAEAFPVIKDLIVDRAAFDRIIAGGRIHHRAHRRAPDANAIPVPKESADLAMDAAACIGCGACVAACPNASAMLFVAAKVSHLDLLPQGQPERSRRVLAMVEPMDAEGFGNCSNHAECEAVCPKEIGVHFISMLNRDYLRASLFSRDGQSTGGDGA